jgi:hypothetical protein
MQLLLGLWAALLAAMHGISFGQVLGVRDQLMSLNMAAHVQYRLGRCRYQQACLMPCEQLLCVYFDVHQIYTATPQVVLLGCTS